MRRINIHIILFMVLMLSSAQSFAQKYEPNVLQMALAELFHNHPDDAGDTIAVEISKKYRKKADIQTAIARAYYRNNANDKARMYLAKAMKVNKHYSPAFVLQGDIFSSESYLDSAEVWYSKAIEADPKNPDGYLKYADTYKYAGRDIKKGVAMLEQMRTAIPWYNVDGAIADLYANSGNSAEANNFFDKVDLNTLSMQQVYTYAIQLYFDQKYDRGIVVSKFGSEKWPQNYTFDRLGLWHNANAGNYQEALDYGKKLYEEVNSDSILSLDEYSMGVAHVGLNNYDEGLSYMKKIGGHSDRWASGATQFVSGIVMNKVKTLQGDKDYETAGDLLNKYIVYREGNNEAYYMMLLVRNYLLQINDMEGDVSGQRATAEKMFAAVDNLEQKHPEYDDLSLAIYWKAGYTYSIFDPNNEQGLAEPSYRKVYDILNARKELTEGEKARLRDACQYLGYYHGFIKKNKAEGRKYYQRLKAVDPQSTIADQALGALK